MNISLFRICILLALVLQPLTHRIRGVANADDRPTVALVLSGGGARGGAHIGVLQRLEEAGVPIDLITGTSVGALVGGLYAAGYSAADIQLILRNVDWNDLFDDRPDRRVLNVDNKKRVDRGLYDLELEQLDLKLPVGLSRGQKIKQLLDRLTAVPTFEAENDYDRLPIRFRAVATDLLTGNAVVFSEGPLSRSLRASMAIPGVFTPVETDSTLLVDGGIADNLPAGLARRCGADIVIAVDVSTPLRKSKDEIRSVIDVLDQAISIHIEENKERNLGQADLVVIPDLGDFSATDFGNILQLVEVGYRRASEMLPEIERLLSVRSIPLGAGRRKVSRLDPASFDLGSLSGLDRQLRVDTVVLAGLTNFPEFAEHYEETAPGRMSGQQIDRRVSSLYGTGDFREVGYRLDKVNDRTVLTYELAESAATKVGFGIRYDLDYKFTGLVDLVSRNVPLARSELFFRGMIGNASAADLGVRIRPFSNQRFAFLPRVYYLSHERRLFTEGGARTPLEDERTGFFLGASYLLGNSGSIQAGYRLERTRRFDLLSATNRGHAVLGGLDLEAQFDSLDDPYFADHGSQLDLRMSLRDPDLGGNTSFRRAATSGRHFFRLTSETVFSVSGEWGMIAGDEVPLLERFFTGGAQYLTFSASPFVGLDRDQILARHHFGSGLALRHQLRAIPLGLIRKVYVGARYQIGLFNQGEDLRRFQKVLHGVGVGLYLDSTYLGPMAVEVGGTDRRDFNVYLSMGYRF